MIAFRNSVGSLATCFLLALSLASRAAYVTLEVPFEMAGHSFGLIQTDSGGDVSRSLSLQSFRTASRTIFYLVDLGDYFDGNFTLWNYTLGSATAGFLSPGQTISADTPALAYNIGVLPFAVDESRYGHTFAVYFPAYNYVFPVSYSSPLGMEVVDGSGNYVWQSFGFFNAWSSSLVDDVNSFEWKLIDVTAGEEGQSWIPNLVPGGWLPLSTGIPTVSVSIRLPDAQSYTLHTSHGSLQSLYPTWTDNFPIPPGYFAS